MDVIDFLNHAFEADSNAMHALIVNRVPCNDKMVNSPWVIVDKVVTSDPEIFQVGMLGIINGLMNYNNLPLVEVKFTEEKDKDGKYKILGFREREEEEEEVE